MKSKISEIANLFEGRTTLPALKSHLHGSGGSQIEHGSDSNLAYSYSIPHIGSRIRHCHTSIGFVGVHSPPVFSFWGGCVTFSVLVFCLKCWVISGLSVFLLSLSKESEGILFSADVCFSCFPVSRVWSSLFGSWNLCLPVITVQRERGYP